MRRIATGLGFLEAPVWLGDGRVLVGELVSGRLLVAETATGAVSTFADVGGAPNGVAVGPDGAFYVCNNGGMGFAVSDQGWTTAGARGTAPQNPVTPSIQRVTAEGAVVTLYTACDSEPLMAPNDLVFDQHGGFYFTDTGRPRGRLTDLGAVYYASIDGESIRQVLRHPAPSRPPTQPNGIGLSPTGDILYVAETATGRLWGWGITGPGEVGPHPQLTDELEVGGAGLLYGASGMAMFDSLAVDAGGRVNVATLRTGVVSVISPEGGLETEIALLEFDPFVTNLCFGGDHFGSAYVTTGGTGSLWEVDWPHRGLPLQFQPS
jgi:gluconolactonase